MHFIRVQDKQTQVNHYSQLTIMTGEGSSGQFVPQCPLTHSALLVLSGDRLLCFQVSQIQPFSHNHEVRRQMQETQDTQNEMPGQSPAERRHKTSTPLRVCPNSIPDTGNRPCKLCSLIYHDILPPGQTAAAQEGKRSKRDSTSLYSAKTHNNIFKVTSLFGLDFCLVFVGIFLMSVSVFVCGTVF